MSSEFSVEKKIDMLVSVSIVLYQTNPSEIIHVYQCLLGSKIKFKLILVDNSPDDQLRFVIKDQKVKYIFNGRNLGFGRAHNLALKEMIRLSDFHLVINSDISFSSNVLSTLIDYMIDHPQVGQIMPKVLSPNGQIQYLCKLLPSPLDLISRRFLPSGIFRERRDKFELRFCGYNQIMEVPYLSGCFMLLRSSALKEIGLFDERFFMYPEDIDLTRRMNEKYRTIYFPDVYILHNHAKESYRKNHMLFIHIINMIKYFNKWGWFYDRKRKRINKLTLQNLSTSTEIIQTA